MTTLKPLLDRLIDYAGLFPPAELAMRPAVENYQVYLRGPHRWMLGRFIVPATKLPELASELARQATLGDGAEPWLISALIATTSQAERFEADLRAIAEFNRRQKTTRHAIVDTVEGKAANKEEIVDAMSLIPPQLELFLELPLGSNLDELQRELGVVPSTRRVMAKIRTGGVVAEAIPSADRVAAFIAGCAAHQIGFKATAGLHHPIRGTYRLTYDEPSPCGVMYGFLNVFVAACAAHVDHRGIDRIEKILTETDAAQFDFREESIVWRGNTWPIDLVREVRNRAVSFGSCSFVEPVDDLRSLNLLP
jgi:hypothetical protein